MADAHPEEIPAERSLFRSKAVEAAKAPAPAAIDTGSSCRRASFVLAVAVALGAGALVAVSMVGIEQRHAVPAAIGPSRHGRTVVRFELARDCVPTQGEPLSVEVAGRRHVATVTSTTASPGRPTSVLASVDDAALAAVSPVGVVVVPGRTVRLHEVVVAALTTRTPSRC